MFQLYFMKYVQIYIQKLEPTPVLGGVNESFTENGKSELHYLEVHVLYKIMKQILINRCYLISHTN